MSAAARRRTSTVLTGCACAAIVLALLAGYCERVVVNSEQFSARATSALRSDSVRALITDRVADKVGRHDSALAGDRSSISAAVAQVVSSRALTDMFRSGVRYLHTALVSGNRTTLDLTLSDISAAVAAGYDISKPKLAAQIRDSGRIELVQEHVGAVAQRIVQVTSTIRVLAWLLLALAIVLVAGAVTAATDRRRSMICLGVGAGIGGVVLVIAYAVARELVIGHFTGVEAKTAASVVWGAFFSDLRGCAWILAGAGAAVAGAAASLSDAAQRAPMPRSVRREALVKLTDPAWLPVAALILAAFCAALIFEFTVAVNATLTLLGIALVYIAVKTMLEQFFAWRREPAQGENETGGRGSPRRRPQVTTSAAVVLIGGALLTFIACGGLSVAAQPRGGCDGSVLLCDRPLNDVALAATHNSMSVPLPGWFGVEQDHPIPQQLRDGIRGLLIDTYYADRLPDGKLRTVGGKLTALRSEAAERGLDSAAISAALRIRGRLGFSGKGQRGLYLCHGFCELGGTSLPTVLDQIHDFLIANPNQVLVIINEDYVKPKDFVKAVNHAGLGSLVYRGSVDRKWPTLRQMISSHQRVVFFAEHKAGGAPWYRLGYEQAINETPYSFKTPAALTDPDKLAASCKPNRGRAKASLLLINNWVSTDPFPLPANAAKVNARAPLLRRLRECERVRHHIPNLVAVNFYAQGDLLGAVDAINGVRTRP